MQHFDTEGNWFLADLSKVHASPKEVQENSLIEGDVLFNTRNSAELVGKAAIWPSNAPQSVYNNNLLRIRFKENVEPKWMALQMRSHDFREHLRAVTSATTSVAAVYQRDLMKLPSKLAPLDEQRRIVARIEELTARSKTAKEALQAIPHLLEKFRQSVLAAAFRGDLTVEWRKRNPTSKITNTEVAFDLHRGSELRDLPATWAWSTVGSAGRVQLGRQRAPQHHSGANMRPYLRVANVFDDRIDTTDVMKMNFTDSEFETYKLCNGDILLNEGQSKELVGRAAIFRDELEDACFQNTLVRFRAREGVEPEYALLVFRHYLYCVLSTNFPRSIMAAVLALSYEIHLARTSVGRLRGQFIPPFLSSYGKNWPNWLSYKVSNRWPRSPRLLLEPCANMLQPCQSHLLPLTL